MRFGIFGGTPIHFHGFIISDRDPGDYAFVNEMMSEYFSEEKHELSPDIWNGIWQYLLEKLSSAANRLGQDVVNHNIKSLMWHTSDSMQFFWGSKFMEFLGSNILEQDEWNLKTLLIRVFARSGLINMFEYQGHINLLKSSETYRLQGLSQGNETKALKFRPLTKKRIRNLNDIKHLLPGEYGIPYASNFPLIDAVIQPNILVQFTVAHKHRDVTHRVSDYRTFELVCWRRTSPNT